MTSSVQSHPWHDKRHHHTDGGFRNVAYPPRHGSMIKATRWALRHLFQKKENTPPPVHIADTLALRRRPEHLRITWIGHSTTLLQTPEHTLLTDPIFSYRASPVPFAGPKRLTPAPFSVRDLPALDAVVLSHDHYDHCDQRTLEEIHQRFAPTFIVPLGVARHLRSWDVGPVYELDWGQHVTSGNVRFHCAPARHFSGRSLFDRNDTLWASWQMEIPTGSGENPLRVYYAGDTGYAHHFRQVRERLGAPDVAILPIGAFRPRWFMEPVHIGPEQALQAFQELKAGHLIPVHWGTFDLADENVQEPPELLRRYAALRDLTHQVHILGVGQSFELTGGGDTQRLPTDGEATNGEAATPPRAALE